jgi:putative hydrolase of the HAD superfamily
VIFDLYNTLISIRTDEADVELWHALARLLRYRGLPADDHALRPAFEAAVRATRRPGERHAEVDVPAAFDAVLAGLGYHGPAPLGAEVAGLFRALSMRSFGVFPDAIPALERLRPAVALGLISDAQRVFLEPELRLAGLASYFPVRVISADYGFRKPDPRLFTMALAALDARPEEAVYVGDHPYHDVCGARAAGLAAVLLARPGRVVKDRKACQPDLTVPGLAEFADWVLGEG